MKDGLKRCRLGDVIGLKCGYGLPQRVRISGNVPVISSSGFLDTHNEARVQGPGVVTGRYGTIGAIYYVEDDFWPLNTTLYVQDFKGNDPRFVSYFLRGIDFHAYSDKAAVPGINRHHLHEANVVFPPFSEQLQISAILGVLDRKIDLNCRMNQTLEALTRALFKDWFIDLGPIHAKASGRAPYLAQDLWDLFPDKLDEEGKPEKWEISTIGNEVRVVGGSTPSTKESEYWGGDIHWATPKDLSNLSAPVLLMTNRRITEAGLSKIGSGLLPVGSVLLSSRAPIGYLAITEVPVAINQGFIGMICDKRVSNVFTQLWTQENMKAVVAKANGSTFQEINKKDFRSLPVVIPEARVLKAFDSIAKPNYQRIIKNEMESRTLAELRDLLLPRLMSGEIHAVDAARAIED